MEHPTLGTVKIHPSPLTHVNPSISNNSTGSNESNESNGSVGNGSGTWDGTTGETRDCPCPLTTVKQINRRGSIKLGSRCDCCPLVTSGDLTNKNRPDGNCAYSDSGLTNYCTKCCDGVYNYGKCKSKQDGWDETHFRWEDCPCGLLLGGCPCCKFGTIVGSGGKKDKCCNGPNIDSCG